jgi:hypothetical protein
VRLFLKLARAGLSPVEVRRSGHKILRRLLLPDRIVYRTSTPPEFECLTIRGQVRVAHAERRPVAAYRATGQPHVGGQEREAHGNARHA